MCDAELLTGCNKYTMVVANKKSKCLKRNNGWKSLSLLFVTDYHYLFLRNGLKVFYYEVETVEMIFETNHTGLVAG